MNGLQLQRYSDQALRQRAYIFGAGVFFMLAGLGAVGAAFRLLYSREQLNVSEKIVIAALGTVSGVLANFVAVLFLRMFSETIRSMVGFHNRLVVTHQMHFANVLAASISNLDLRDETLAKMALSVAELEGSSMDARRNGATNEGAQLERGRLLRKT